jgi:putative membrane protein
MGLIVRWVLQALALLITAWIVPGFTVTRDPAQLMLVAAVFGLVNAFIRPVIKVLTCPLIIITLGLFTLVINAAMLWLTKNIVPSYLSYDGLLTLFIASIVLAIASTILNTLVKDRER